MAILEVKNLTVGYGAPVVRDVSFCLRAGEVVGLLGRNGSGKTTLLRGLCGSAKVLGGTALLGGENCLTMKPRQRARHLALLAQRTELLAGLRAGEVITMGGYARQGVFERPGPAEEKRARQAAARLGVEALWDRDCAALSEGQRQLVHLARVTAQETEVLLLDEPSSALDFTNTHRLFGCVRGLAREENRAALVVLHDPALALRWCDRLLRLEEGRLTGELTTAQAAPEQVQTFLQPLYPGLLVRKDEESRTFYCVIA